MLYSRWQAAFTSCVGRVRDRQAGQPTLLFDSEVDEQWLYDRYFEGTKPKQAAERWLAGEGRNDT